MSAVAPIGLGYNIKTTNIQSQFNIDGDTLYVGGDGPNNYTTIQSAIDDAVDGDTVFVYDIQPGVSWVKTFGLPDYNDEVYSVRQTSDDGYIMTGFSRSYSSDHYEDAWLVKTDRYGNEEWSRTFGESGPLNIDIGRSVQQTSDGGYVFFGNTMSYSSLYIDAWLVKTDKDGNEEWNKTYGGDNTEHGNSVFQTSDNGYILAGYNTSSDSGHAWLFKVDDKGVEQWSKNFYPGYSATGLSAQQTIDGGYVMAGRVFKDGGVQGGFLVKTDPFGNEQWNKTYGESIGSHFEFVQQTSDLGFILCGYLYSEAWLVKTDKDGNEEWNRTFNDPPNLGHCAFEVDQTVDNGFILVGQCNFALLDNSWIIKTDSNGNKEWQINIEETEKQNSKNLYSIQQTSNGGYIAAGEDGGDVMLVKVDLFENKNPSAPTIKGPNRGIPYLPLTFTAVSNDPDGDLISYFFDWDEPHGDFPYTYWTEPFGTSASRSHKWENSGIYHIKVKAMDEHYVQSDWSTFEVNLPRTRIWQGFMDMFPILERILALF